MLNYTEVENEVKFRKRVETEVAIKILDMMPQIEAIVKKMVVETLSGREGTRDEPATKQAPLDFTVYESPKKEWERPKYGPHNPISDELKAEIKNAYAAMKNSEYTSKSQMYKRIGHQFDISDGTIKKIVEDIPPRPYVSVREREARAMAKARGAKTVNIYN